MESSLQERIKRARCSLEGLSVGDAFGETFFISPDVVEGLIAQRALATRTWNYTDDTQMALSIFSVLRQYGHIHQPTLARSFAERYDSARGYGPAMHRLLWEIKCGEDWSERASSLFAGQGSFGNGAAMRVAPIGAFFADDIEAVVEHATRSSVITHTHDEAIAGTIAVAVAVALAHNLGASGVTPARSEFLDLVLPHVPESEAGFDRRETWPPLLRSNLRFQFWEMALRYPLKTRYLLPYGVRVRTWRITKRHYG